MSAEQNDNCKLAAVHLAQGHPLFALKAVALDETPSGLALRGIALAQLGELEGALKLLQQATKLLVQIDPILNARSIVAQAEIHVALRNLTIDDEILERAIDTLRRVDEHPNVLSGYLIKARKLVLLGRLEEAKNTLIRLDFRFSSPIQLAIAKLILAEICIRKIQVDSALQLLKQARQIAQEAGIQSLASEISETILNLNKPYAKLQIDNQERVVKLQDIQNIQNTSYLIVDSYKRSVYFQEQIYYLNKRPILFHLLKMLAIRWPREAPRESIIKEIFETQIYNDSMRARLRVEVGRLRKIIANILTIEATEDGYRITCNAKKIAVIEPLIESTNHQLLGLLSDGNAWSTSALSLALGLSQRSVQRFLSDLEEDGQVYSTGEGRNKKWLIAPISNISTMMLLPSMGTT